MPDSTDCHWGRSQLLTSASDKIVMDALTLKKIALLVGQSFYDVQLSRTNEILLTSLDSYLGDTSLKEEEARKSSLLLNGYLDAVRDLLQDTEGALSEATNQIAFILAASGHGVASGRRDDE